MGLKRYAAVSIVFVLLLLPNAFGGGFMYDGLGVKARGMGGAFRAVADDWSAAYYNPAGYIRIQDNMLAGNLDIFHNRYSVTPEIWWGGTYSSGYYNGQEIANQHYVNNVPQFGTLARFPIWDEMVLGFSIMQTFDQNQNWVDVFGFDGIEGYGTRDLPNNLVGINLDVVAFQVTAARSFMDEKFSAGIGISVLRADLSYTDLLLRDNPLLDFPDAAPYVDRPFEKIPQWYYNNGNGWGLGYKMGFLYSPTDKIDLGFVYTGKSSVTIKGDYVSTYYMGDNPGIATPWQETDEEYLFFSGIDGTVTADFETTLDLPASIGLGTAFKFNDKLTLAIDGEYVFWSQFEGLDFEYSNYVIPVDPSFHIINDSLVKKDIPSLSRWDDVFRVMAGINYQLKDFVQLRGGFCYDQSPTDKETTTLHFIDLGDKYSYSVGASFDIGYWQVSISGVYTHHPDLNVENIADINNDGLMDNLAGTYKADNYQTILGFTYRF